MHNFTDYAKLRELIEVLDTAHPDCKFQLQNLRAAVLLVPNLSLIQQQELNARLYLLERTTSWERRLQKTQADRRSDDG